MNDEKLILRCERHEKLGVPECDIVDAMSWQIGQLESQLADALYALDRISDSDVSTSTGHLRDIANEVIHNTPVPEGE